MSAHWQRAQQKIDALSRPKIGHVQDEKWSSEIPSSRRTSSRVFVGDRGVKKFGMTSICFAQSKRFLSLPPQTFRNSRDRIGMNERMLDCGAVIAVLSEQGRVGPVQSRDNLRRAIADHFRGQKSGDGVRHSVMHVKNIERFCAADFRHLYGKRQCVIGTRKQSVFHSTATS